MKHEVIIPSMGESISEATISKIIAPPGTVVKADGELIELETDKVNQVLYAAAFGKIEWKVRVGEVVKVGQAIGTIDTEYASEESPSDPIKSSVFLEKPSKIILEKTKEEIWHSKEDFIAEFKPKTKELPRINEELLKEEAVSNEVKNIPVKRETRRPLSKIRKVIASRLVEAQHTMAMLTTFNEIDLTHVIQLREEFKEPFFKKYGCKLGFMSFFVKAVASALHAFPDLNAYLDKDEIVQREYYDIGVAVGTDKGVIVPVLRDCDRRSFAEVEQMIENYAKKAREGSLNPNDLQGGGFTITNGGIYGSLLSTPILLPPQCGILGMHKIEKRPVVIQDQIVIRSMMYVALSYDHRLIDGKEAVSFLVHIKNLLEEPSRFLLEI